MNSSFIKDKTIRFSLASCKTEESIASSIATPIDASPQPRPLNTPSVIINIINDDPLPNTKVYQIIRRRPSAPPPEQQQQSTRNKIKKLWPKLKHIVSKPSATAPLNK
ncbi:hypothetical protein G6F70_001512 [Rhizopus microsporus]|uniref:Uncharacterized protein n=2 Tax=Rhizopus TaxID=4842 RepID=A0A367ISC3_RHIAZ|nr:hypothetical protein G6F71_000734 [Rhizopus microsporus]RCH80529.1 hypothetical protein CU097_004765 [Rhizopus azygosporus]KAG1203288.1 hypothetical protein G6F70_001512 [Rhizopus microsporus]KAG1214470.1 hypothetical protein G6F69_001903 [Rhizopus microsporus]KAG1236736.1 hypothetical protein G6F67_001749 [Rhizopus microsporus]